MGLEPNYGFYENLITFYDNRSNNFQVYLYNLEQQQFYSFNENKAISSHESLQLANLLNPLEIKINEPGEYVLNVELRDNDGKPIKTKTGRIKSSYEITFRDIFPRIKFLFRY